LEYADSAGKKDPGAGRDNNESDPCNGERNHIQMQINHSAEGINKPKKNSFHNVILTETEQNDKALSKPIEAMRPADLTNSHFSDASKIYDKKNKQTPWPLVRERTIPTG
jgi:hypothetical protein